MVHLVEDDERLRVEAGGEPVHKDGYHIRLGVAGSEPHAALHFAEAQELHHVMAFVHH